MACNLIARRTVSGVADVQVPCEQHICAALRNRFHSQLRAVNQVVLAVAFRQIEGMMRDYDFDDFVREGAEPRAYCLNLLFVDAPVLDGKERAVLMPRKATSSSA